MSENDVDAARNFIGAALDGKFKSGNLCCSIQQMIRLHLKISYQHLHEPG